MTDICGQADRIIELRTNAAITTARNFKRDIEPCGRCHNCDEHLDDPRKLFCDAECSEDHEKRVRNGR